MREKVDDDPANENRIIVAGRNTDTEMPQLGGVGKLRKYRPIHGKGDTLELGLVISTNMTDC